MQKAASMANKKVMQAFKEIDSSVNGEDGTIDKDIPGVGDDRHHGQRHRHRHHQLQAFRR